jgi:SAM-dependent methyltransferase
LVDVDSDEVRRQWADRTGEYSPEYYAYYGPDGTSEAIRERLVDRVGRDAAVLELGCSSGRHLAHLHEHGFTDLSGIEVNDEAFDVMADTYPDLAAAGRFHHAAIESVLPEFGADRFDAVYSVETLQHIHPDNEWVFAELARVTDDLLLTVENEGEGDPADPATDDVNFVHDEFPLYYRDWERVFTDRGFEQVESASLERDTLRVFRQDD